ncbi:MAG: NAD-dependent epimerase/dehydratase family protein [Oscillospiraceae bacterium]
MKKKVLVTGAGGYIGRHVVKNILDLGHDVVAIDFKGDGIDSRAEVISYDILNSSENVYTDLKKPDVCLHMAWRDGFVHNSHAHIECLSAHFDFIKKMINGGLKHLAVMGTMHEVGYFEGSIKEDTPTNPLSMYGIAKDALRRSVFMLKNGDITIQWIRAFYIYGDDVKSNSIFAKLTLAEKENKETFPFTSGKNKFDFIHVNDLAHQIAKTVIQNEVDGVINCCSGEPISLADKVESYIKEHKFNIKLQYGAFPDRQYDSPGVWGDNSKIKQILSK